MKPINTAMFQRIHTQITTRPETHNQSFFEMPVAECGTTRCIAGWGIYFEAFDRGYNTNATAKDCARRYLREERVPRAGLTVTEAAGAHILGLPEVVAERLFYTMNEEQAVEYVAELATGSIPADLEGEF